MTTVFALLRALHFASLMTVFGATALAALARQGRNDAALRLQLLLAAMAALLTSLAGATVHDEMFVLRTGLLLGMGLLLVLDAAPLPTALTAGFALALLGFASHAAAAGDPGYVYVRAAIDALHLLTAGFWVGGLVALLPPLFARPRDTARLVAALRLFSGWAMGSVAVLAVAGTLNGVAILGGNSGRWSNAYLTWLAVKLVLAGLMIALALTNRFGVLPGLVRGEAEAADTIPLTIVTELVCAALILLAAGFLGLTAPLRP